MVQFGSIQILGLLSGEHISDMSSNLSISGQILPSLHMLMSGAREETQANEVTK